MSKSESLNSPAELVAIARAAQVVGDARVAGVRLALKQPVARCRSP